MYPINIFVVVFVYIVNLFVKIVLLVFHSEFLEILSLTRLGFTQCGTLIISCAACSNIAKNISAMQFLTLRTGFI